MHPDLQVAGSVFVRNKEPRPLAANTVELSLPHALTLLGPPFIYRLFWRREALNDGTPLADNTGPGQFRAAVPERSPTPRLDGGQQGGFTH